MLFNNGFYGQDIVKAFSPPEYCRLFAQKKAYQGGVTGTPGPPPSYAPDLARSERPETKMAALGRDGERLDPRTRVLAVLARISERGYQTLFIRS